LKKRQNRAIHISFAPAHEKKRAAHEVLMRTIHAVRMDENQNVRREEHEKSA